MHRFCTHNLILCVHVDDARAVALGFLGFKARVCQDNDEISGGAPARRRAVELHRAGPCRPRDHIRLEPRPIVDIDDINFLERENLRGLHEQAVERQAALIVQIGRGDRRPMDLRLEQFYAHTLS